MQDYNTIIGAIQMRLNKCPTRSVMDRFRICLLYTSPSPRD